VTIFSFHLQNPERKGMNIRLFYIPKRGMGEISISALEKI
jgi:hypothetical protein